VLLALVVTAVVVVGAAPAAAGVPCAPALRLTVASTQRLVPVANQIAKSDLDKGIRDI